MIASSVPSPKSLEHRLAAARSVGGFFKERAKYRYLDHKGRSAAARFKNLVRVPGRGRLCGPIASKERYPLQRAFIFKLAAKRQKNSGLGDPYQRSAFGVRRSPLGVRPHRLGIFGLMLFERRVNLSILSSDQPLSYLKARATGRKRYWRIACARARKDLNPQMTVIRRSRFPADLSPQSSPQIH